MGVVTPARVAITAPGRLFGPYAPLLTFAGRAATERGSELRPLTWSDSELAAAERDGIDPAEWVRGQVDAQLPPRSGPETSTVIIGKSLGSYAARVAADEDVPAVWLTPLLHDATVMSALRAATAPFLLIGGTADREAWSTALAHDLTPHVCEIMDGDHGLYVPGPLANSTAALGIVATAVEQFLDQTVWPV